MPGDPPSSRTVRCDHVTQGWAELSRLRHASGILLWMSTKRMGNNSRSETVVDERRGKTVDRLASYQDDFFLGHSFRKPLPLLRMRRCLL